MAKIIDWEKDLSDMKPTKLAKIHKALNTLCEEWPMFTEEFEGMRVLYTLVNIAMRETVNDRTNWK